MANSNPQTPEPIAPTAGPSTAEPNAGAMPESFAQAILDNHAWRLDPRGSTYAHMGVPTFGPGDPVPSDHPAFATMLEQGLLLPIVRPGQEPPEGYDAQGFPLEVVDTAAADAALKAAGKG